jgi:hypothetical protein
LFLSDDYTHLKKYYLSPPGLPSLVKSWNDTVLCLAVENNHLVMATPDFWPGGSEFSIELYSIQENHDIVLKDKRFLGNSMIYRPRQIIMNDPYLFIRIHGGVVVYSVSEEKSLVLCDEYFIDSGYTHAMTQNNDFLFLVTTEGTLVLKKTDPNNLELHQKISAPVPNICAQDNLILYA